MTVMMSSTTAMKIILCYIAGVVTVSLLLQVYQ